MAEPRDWVGQIVGEYRLLSKLGGGSFGQVYLAEHIRDSNQVALKLLQVHLTAKEDFRAFLNEARTMRLRHPHIVPLLDFGLSLEDMPFLVMEYAPLGTLRNRHPKGSRVAPPTVVEYATQIASALQYAHDAHIIHRDVKPENMLMRDEQTILLSDFGIATTVHSTRSVMANAGVGGTVPYMAPEQLDGQPRPASDQYALGIVVYEWLAGRCPFQGTAVEISMQHAIKPPPSLVKQIPELPAEVEEVIFKALAKDPKERFASIQAFANALQQASHPPTIRKPASPMPSKEALVPMLPPATPSSHPAATPPPMMQKPVTPSKLPVTQMPVLRAEKPPALLSSGTMPKTAKTKVSAPPPQRKRGFSKGYVALLVVMVLLLIGGGSYTYIRIQVLATATALAPTAMKTYAAHVAKNGIMFGFDAQHTHYNPYERIVNTTNVSYLQQLWTAPTGAEIDSSPALADELVYVGSWDDKLYAFDALTGKQKWSASTGGAIFSSPAVANGLVYVGSNDGKLYAFDALTGIQKWSASTDSANESSPAVANELVYIGSNDGKLYAFDALTGIQKWSASTGGAIISSPAIANGLVYAGSNDSKLYAFDALTGIQKWSASTGGTIFSSPTIANGLAYIGSWDDKLYAFDALTGQQKWSASTGNKINFSSPTLANGLVYVGSDDDNLYAFSLFGTKP